ncbi:MULTISPECIES: hypothetical protein [Hyphomonas]|uniref:hypothetical protein n=1 Tax=Hyphomonas TaxID=85 RepID=UPI00235615C3|nr:MULTISPECIES: hypothetical protein [Hyphomonas]
MKIFKLLRYLLAAFAFAAMLLAGAVLVWLAAENVRANGRILLMSVPAFLVTGGFGTVCFIAARALLPAKSCNKDDDIH